MKFYRTLQPFKVISFDLDDTLYDNTEVIRAAEQHCVDFLRHTAQLETFDLDNWLARKAQIERQDPIQCEDVTLWRIKTIRTLLEEYGKNEADIERICHDVISSFLEWRHKIDVPQQSIAVLNHLKQQYKLAALTNGNVVPERIGLTQFELTLRAGKHGRAKPHQDLFRQAAAYFNVRPQEILHIGDNLLTDVQGALQAGAQAVWLNLSGLTFEQSAEAGVPPTLEINELSQLITL